MDVERKEKKRKEKKRKEKKRKEKKYLDKGSNYTQTGQAKEFKGPGLAHGIQERVQE